MNIAAPQFIGWAILIPLLLVMWFLKIRRRKSEVSSVLLWKKALEDQRVKSPFQRLVKNLLLLFQLLCLLFLILGLLRPESGSIIYASRLNVIMLDRSASMSSLEEDGRTRFEIAKEKALDRIEEVDGERAVLISFGENAEVLTPVTTDGSLLARMVNEVSPGSGVTNFEDALELALSVVRQDELIPAAGAGSAGTDGSDGSEELLSNQPDARIFLISDGVVPEWKGDSIEVPVIVDSVGFSSSNVGIIAFAARREFTEEGDLKVLLELKNTGDDPLEGVLRLLGDGEVLKETEPKTLEGKESWILSFETISGPSLQLEARWIPTKSDALALDDSAWLVLENMRKLRVVQVGRPNLLLENALLVIESVELFQIEYDEVDPETLASEFDVAVWDGEVPEELPTGLGHLIFNAVPKQFWKEEPPLVEAPRLVSWKKEDPVLRFSSLAPLDGRILKTFPLPKRPGTSGLVECREGSIISRFSTKNLRGLVVSFDIFESSWPLSPSFPFFVDAALRDLGRLNNGINSGLRSGDLLEIEPGVGIDRLDHKWPSGKITGLSLEDAGFARLRLIDELGVHHFHGLSQRKESAEDEDSNDFQFNMYVPLNLLSLEESRIEPRPDLDLGGAEVDSSISGWGESRREYWRILLALGLICLLGEWAVFHRR